MSWQRRFLGSRNVNEIYQRCYICIVNCHKILFSSNWKKLICTSNSKISSIQGSRKSIRALGKYLSTNVLDNWSIHTYRNICFLIPIWKGKKISLHWNDRKFILKIFVIVEQTNVNEIIPKSIVGNPIKNIL